MRRFIVRTYFFVIIFCLASIMAGSQNFSDGFNFYLPADDSSTQLFLPSFPAREIESFITIDANGHFSTEGNPIRFWGVNLTTGSCFPVKEKSPYIAARMRKMGINLVRFHHMDNGWSNNAGTIFIRGTGNTRQLDAQALDRLFFLLAQMKKNAVYANLNLHVSRTFLEGDGVLNADSLWQFGKGVTYFDPHLILLQKEFARQLLTTLNPYTDLTLAQDPVVAMIEISNENTLYGMWKGSQLRKFQDGGNITRWHADMLDARWIQFLKDKYNTHAQLALAWGESMDSGSRANQLLDGDFELGNVNAHWGLELHSFAQATLETSEEAFRGAFSAKVDVTQVTTTAWHIQLKQNGLSMKKDSSYVLEFYAKADQDNRMIGIGFQRDEDPWTWYGGTNVSLRRDWQRYRISLTAPEENNNHLRLTINFANETGPVWFDNMVFSKPKAAGLDQGEDLDQGLINRTDYAQRHFYHRQRMADLAEFYLEIQRSYFQEMYGFLKNELSISAPITGTNALVGPSDLYTQQDLDYIDDHAYWSHPSFPSEAWSPTDWFIDNVSLLAREDLGTIGNIFSGLAMEGKPYTVSEYNHPFPNRYQWEMMPVLASYASFHDADGLMFFEYNGGTNDDWETDFIDGFFPIHRNNSLMSMSPIFAFAYRNYMISTAAENSVVHYSADFIFDLPARDNMGRWGKYLPYAKSIASTKSVRTVGFSADSTILPDLNIPPSNGYLTNTGEVGWDYRSGIHSINASRIQSVTGNLPQFAQTKLDHLKILSSSGQGVVSWVSLDDADLPDSDISLLSIHSQIQNSNMVWDGDRTVRDQWGGAPTLIRPLVVQVELALNADSIHVFPLDSRGKENTFYKALPDASGRFNLEINQKGYVTPWFGIRSYQSATDVIEISEADFLMSVHPNPTKDLILLDFQLSRSSDVVIQLFDLAGRQIRTWSDQGLIGQNRIVKYIGEITPGIHILTLKTQYEYGTEMVIKW